MNVFNELPTAFPWYDNIKKQHRYRLNVVQNAPVEMGLISPKNALLPFEFVKPVSATISEWWIFDSDGTPHFQITNPGVIKTIIRRGMLYSYYNGTELTANNAPLNLAEGCYYSRIKFSDGFFFYSEVFCVPSCRFLNTDTDVPFLKLVWYNDTDLTPIFYNDYTNGIPYFQNVLYLDTFIHQSEPEIIIEGEKDGNDEVIPSFTKQINRYRISHLIPDFLKNPLVAMAMHDHVFLTDAKGVRNGEIDQLSTQTTAEQGGALATIDILFEDELLVKRGCGENMI